MRLANILVALGYYVAATFSQDTSVTLWEFGVKRLAGGETTLPLIPIGTPSDGLSTTYIYEVLNPTTMLVTEGATPMFTISAIPGRTLIIAAHPDMLSRSPNNTQHIETRTIVASASGWVEAFGTVDTIQCNLLDSDSGICFDASRTNTGNPTPRVLAVETSPSTSTSDFTDTPSSQTPSLTSIISSTALPTTSMTPRQSRSSVGAIVGGTVAGTLVAMMLVLWLFQRRKRSKLISEEAGRVVEPLQYPIAVNPTATTQSRGLGQLEQGHFIEDSTTTPSGSKGPAHVARTQAQGWTRMLLPISLALSKSSNSNHEDAQELDRSPIDPPPAYTESQWRT
ncbi:hypothetical protein C8R42DRAFT_722802 [Lentinula raphanica]|nr:hypothetical protein C8R42DRAFT_722802 [Lentinula raphanica]